MTQLHAEIRPRLPLLFGLLLIIGYLFVTTVELARSSYDIAGVFLVGPVLALISVPMLARARRTEPDPRVGQLFTLGLLFMVFAGFAHSFVDFSSYGGVADARSYSTYGTVLAAQFWQGDFVPHLGVPLVGSGFINLLTGIFYALIGPTIIGGYLVYSWLAFWGLYFCYCAFRIAMPGADHRRYALLVLFLPSLVFWSSGIGKGAWMTLCIGLALLGAARLLSRTPRSMLPLLAGLGGTALVRPHITAILVMALFTGVLIRRAINATLLNPIIRATTVVAMVIAGAVVVSYAATFLKLDTLSISSLTDALNKQENVTSDLGNSAFNAYSVHSPLDFPGALVTVLFRPFPWEAKSLVVLISAVESTAVVAFVAFTWRRWSQAPRLLRQYPYLMLALLAILLFVIAFSTLGNFGLLVRERVMIYPLVLVPLCLARPTPASTNEADYAAVERVALP